MLVRIEGDRFALTAELRERRGMFGPGFDAESEAQGTAIVMARRELRDASDDVERLLNTG